MKGQEIVLLNLQFFVWLRLYCTLSLLDAFSFCLDAFSFLSIYLSKYTCTSLKQMIAGLSLSFKAAAIANQESPVASHIKFIVFI